MDKEISTFEAKCADCQKVFDHPSLGDMAYGEFIFCSENGKVYAYCNAFEAAPKLIEVLLPENLVGELFQPALSALADPIFGQQLTNSIHCPNCGSVNLEYWHGDKTGTMMVKTVTYNHLLSLDRNELKEQVIQFAANYIS